MNTGGWIFMLSSLGLVWGTTDLGLLAFAQGTVRRHIR